VAANDTKKPKDRGPVLSNIHLRKAARTLRAGGLIAYPTEAVWGLGCDPENQAAVMRLLALKQRPIEKGLIVIASDFAEIEHWLMPLAEKVEDRAFRTWPGPHTWLWPATPEAPPWITGGSSKIAVRITRHPAAVELCDAVGPLVSTSANRAGEVPARNVTEVRLRFGRAIDVVPGPIGRATRPTIIRDLLSGRTVRA
jgi:L-threonylcarbamoyladenylate synthase